MYSPKELEKFFTQYLPKTKQEIEKLWADNRGELNEYLQDWVAMAGEGWMANYMQDMLYWSKTGSHRYTNPWDML